MFNSLRHSQKKHEQYTMIQFTLGNTCTYACSYCPSNLHDGSVGWLEHDKILGFMQQVHQHYTVSQQRKVIIDFTGGEPTLYPRFVELVRELKSLGFIQSIITNGSVKLSTYEELAGLLQQVCLTYHIESVKHEHFKNVLKIFAGVIRTHVNLTCIPGRTQECLEIAKELFALNPQASFNLKVLRKDFKHELYDYEESELELMKTQFQASWEMADEARGNMTFDSGLELGPNQIMLKRLNDFHGWSCKAGLESLVVDMKGDVYRAVCKAGGKLGRIGESVTLPTAEVICPKASCGCAADIMISKSKVSGIDLAV